MTAPRGGPEARRAALARRAEALRERRRRRRWRWLLLLPLLWLLHDCDCAEPEPEPPAGPAEPAPTDADAEPATPAVPAPTGRVAPRPRPALTLEPAPALSWLAPMSAQVTARGPRLAACFVDTPRPGALRWSARVDPVRGEVSDQALEPTLVGAALEVEQRDCLLRALAEPGYRLQPGPGEEAPRRVGLVLEF